MINFIFCIHIHQPVGNFDYVIRDAFKRAYLPFLKTLKEYPEIKFCLHISGVLIDWLKGHEGDYLRLLRSMVDKGQLELMSAGYYEPILTAIPERDRIGQITLMIDKLEKLFRVRTKGLWVTERVWEPHLPKTLSEAGMEYAVVDDYHFIKAGLRYEDLYGYYLTEEEGCVVKVFPGSERLRYLIPFQPVEGFLEYLKSLNLQSQVSSLIVFADDGEKFGIWPGTYDHAYNKGWLKRFLSCLAANKGWLQTTTFSEYLKDNEPLGRVYLPTASYREMEEWALPGEASEAFSSLYNEVKGWQDAARLLRFLRGGFWRNFLAKYPESDWMHKRMLFVSERVKSLESKVRGQSQVQNLKSKISNIKSLLYKSQCNDAYWHGVFGGLYLPHLRSAVYENLIKAERLLDSIKQPAASTPDLKYTRPNAPNSKFFKSCALSFKSNNPERNDSGAIRIIEHDFDCDTHKELRLTTPTLDIFIDLRQGASIRELDYRPKAYNLLNVLSRHKEGYHKKTQDLKHPKTQNSQEAKSIHDLIMTKEMGIERLLVYDDYLRGAFHDRFLKCEDVTPEELIMGDLEEMGDFVHGEYSINYELRMTNDELQTKNSELSAIHLLREGSAFAQPVRIEKTFHADGDKPQFMVKYTITNLGSKEINCIFASEVNLSLGFSLERKPLDYGETSEFVIGDDWLGFNLVFSLHPEARLFTYPVETVSLSEGGIERLFQGNCVLSLWRLLLNPSAPVRINVSLNIRER